jgi:hypothetical protein
MRASATAKMTAKGIKHVEITAISLGTPPFRRMKRPNAQRLECIGRLGWRVSDPFKVIRKRINVYSTDSTGVSTSASWALSKLFSPGTYGGNY